MVNRDSDFTLMHISVHVTVHNKINIPRFFHADNLDPVFLQVLPLIQITVPEAENLCRFVGTAVITPQFALLNKRHNVRTLIGLILHILVRNTQIDSLAGQFRMLSIIQLLCISFKVQQHHARLRIPHPVKVCYIIIIGRLVLRRI